MFRLNLLVIVLAFVGLIDSFTPDEYLAGKINEHKSAVNAVAFSPDGRYIVSGGDDKLLLISDRESLEPLYKHLDNYYPPKALEVTKANTIFVSAGPDIRLVDFNNKTLALFKGNTTPVWSIDYAPERNKLAAGSYDYTIKIWDVATQEIELILKGHEKSTLPVAFSPDEKYLVSGSLDRTVKVWNAKTGELLKTLEIHSDNIYDIEFHPSGKYFASASRDQTIRLWNFETGKVIRTFVGHDKGIMDIEFLPDGNHLVSASLDGSIRLWQTKTGKMVYTFTGHEGAVNALAVSPDGMLMASGGSDSKVLIWNLSKKIFVEFAYYDEFESAKSQSGLFDPKRSGEKKTEYDERMQRANELEVEIIDKFYKKYLNDINNQSME
jgi:WD40 repeat protein